MPLFYSEPCHKRDKKPIIYLLQNIRFKIPVIMKQFGISISTMMIRFYMMVIIVIIAGFLNQWWLSLIGGAVFMSSLLGLVWKEKQK